MEIVTYINRVSFLFFQKSNFGGLIQMEIQTVEEIPQVERGGGIRETTREVLGALESLKVGQTVQVEGDGNEKGKSMSGRCAGAIKHAETNTDKRYKLSVRKEVSYVTRTK